MTESQNPIRYREPMINLYVEDVEGLAAFYCKNFGFVETFRTPQEGEAVHIEVRIDEFIVGFAAIEAARAMHQLPLNPGNPRSEIAMWTDDVDQAYAALLADGATSISAPHNFLEVPPLRAAWVADPEGNHIQIVCHRR